MKKERNIFSGLSMSADNRDMSEYLRLAICRDVIKEKIDFRRNIDGFVTIRINDVRRVVEVVSGSTYRFAYTKRFRFGISKIADDSSIRQLSKFMGRRRDGYIEFPMIRTIDREVFVRKANSVLVGMVYETPTTIEQLLSERGIEKISVATRENFTKGGIFVGEAPGCSVIYMVVGDGFGTYRSLGGEILALGLDIDPLAANTIVLDHDDFDAESTKKLIDSLGMEKGEKALIRINSSNFENFVDVISI